MLSDNILRPSKGASTRWSTDSSTRVDVDRSTRAVTDPDRATVTMCVLAGTLRSLTCSRVLLPWSMNDATREKTIPGNDLRSSLGASTRWSKGWSTRVDVDRSTRAVSDPDRGMVAMCVQARTLRSLTGSPVRLPWSIDGVVCCKAPPNNGLRRFAGESTRRSTVELRTVLYRPSALLPRTLGSLRLLGQHASTSLLDNAIRMGASPRFMQREPHASAWRLMRHDAEADEAS